MCRGDAPCLHSQIAIRNHQFHLYFAATRFSTGDGIEGLKQPPFAWIFPAFQEVFSEPLTITHQAPKVRFNSSQPNQVAIAVADVWPQSFLGRSNPALAMGLTGNVHGLVTLVDGDKQCTVDVSFEITPSGALGRLVDGVFQEVDRRQVWTITSDQELQGVDPVVYLYVQVTRPANDFNANPPTTMTVQLRSFRPDGSAVSAGVSVPLVLVSSGSSGYVYQSQKPILLINNTAYEGDRGSLIAVASDDGCSTQVVRLPP